MNSDIKGIIKVQYLISVYPGKTAMRKTHQFKEEYDAILDMTLENELPFDKTHPLYFDKGFRKLLLEYYKQKENYEKCAKISRLLSN